MSLEIALIIWGVCGLIVVLTLSLDILLLSPLGAQSPKFGRNWRIVLVLLAPLTVVCGLLWLLPPSRLFLYMMYRVLIKK